MTSENKIAFGAIEDLEESARAEVRALSSAVYPPTAAAEWPGRHLDWARPRWCVRLWDEAGALVSYTGVVLAEGTFDGRPVRIGGIGGVMTHPQARKRGHAATCTGRAAEFFREQGAHFALLVCKPSLLAYYGSLGWKSYEGTLKTLQQGQKQVFTFNRVMVMGVGEQAPEGGVIDLEGPPW